MHMQWTCCTSRYSSAGYVFDRVCCFPVAAALQPSGRDESSVQQALQAAPLVHELLLDSGKPSLAVKQLGGTGRLHDWTHSRRIVELAGVPVWLAGGLNPANARAAIEAVQPHGLDVCTGLRVNEALDEARLEAFARAVRG